MLYRFIARSCNKQSRRTEENKLPYACVLVCVCHSTYNLYKCSGNCLLHTSRVMKQKRAEESHRAKFVVAKFRTECTPCSKKNVHCTMHFGTMEMFVIIRCVSWRNEQTDGKTLSDFNLIMRNIVSRRAQTHATNTNQTGLVCYPSSFFRSTFSMQSCTWKCIRSSRCCCFKFIEW